MGCIGLNWQQTIGGGVKEAASVVCSATDA